MEFDPLARDVAPPRHEIESDSEEEISSLDTATKRRAFVPPKVHIDLTSAAASDHLIIFISEGGEGYLHGDNWSEEGVLLINDEQQGAFTNAASNSTSALILLLRPSIQVMSDQACFAYIGAAILSGLKPKSVTIIDDYNSAFYITSKESSTPQMRVLSSKMNGKLQKGTALYESPNYILGLAAALMNEAVVSRIPSKLYLIPQNTNAHLQSLSRLHPNSSSLDTKSKPLDEEIAAQLSSLLSLEASRSIKAQNKRSLTSFLDSRRTQSRHKMAASLSAMYV